MSHCHALIRLCTAIPHKVCLKTGESQFLTLHTQNCHCAEITSEFVELYTMFLNHDTPGQPFTFKRPGALHKARWMAKLLYSIKICLFEKQIQQLPNGSVTMLHQVSKIRDLVTFSIFIYSCWWMKCSSAADALWSVEWIATVPESAALYEAVNALIYKSAVRALNLSKTAHVVPNWGDGASSPVRCHQNNDALWLINCWLSNPKLSE